MPLDKVELIENTGVTAGTYSFSTITVASDGRITSASSGTPPNSVFPTGTRLVFHQAAAPTGWTRDDSLNDYALKIVSTGGGSSGGTNTFSGVFNTSVGTSGGSVDVHTLTITEIPSHDHAGTTSGNGGHIHNMWLGDPSIPPGSGETAIWREDVSGGRGYYTNDSTGVYPYTQEAGWHSHTVYAQGGGGGHAHGFTNPTFNLDVRYATAIVCTKD